MSQPMASGYNPIAVESAWYDWWETQGFFAPKLNEDGSPQDASKGTFVIPAPPPNVTGALHIGHGLTVAIQDTLIRWCIQRLSMNIGAVLICFTQQGIACLGKQHCLFLGLIMPEFPHNQSSKNVCIKRLASRVMTLVGKDFLRLFGNGSMSMCQCDMVT
jgi:tRNA synthetases class I (I, L, M and V)